MASSSRARLWQRICSLSRAGVPIKTAMDFLRESKTAGPSMARFVEHQCIAMRSSGFADGASGWVPKEELIVIEITQEGRIAEGFEQASRMATVRSKLRSTLISGLAYPTVLLIVSSGAIAVLPGHALDVMMQITDTATWPPVSLSVLNFSQFITVWGFPLAFAFAAIVALSIWSAPRWTGEVRKKVDWFPPFVLYRRFTGPEILTAWIALMQAGVQRVRALGKLENGLPDYLAFHVRTMRSQLYRGEPVEKALDTGLFSADTLDDMRVYERTGDFSVNANLIAEEDIKRSLARLESFTKTLSSVLLLLIGSIAIWIYIGIAQVAFTFQQAVL
ncbi:MAG: type II secretion system F family protein [Acidiferrobacterales bacterium]|nr:type II secretion system F family protein [Acidiferrobacterales bacterium]